MSDYLKDSFIPYLTIDTVALDSINDDLQTIVNEASSLPENEQLKSNVYTLRYDGMGIVRKDYSEIKRCFETGRNIERVNFNFSSLKNLSKYKGKGIRILLDAADGSRCYLSVSDDDEKWVDNVYKRLSTRLEKYKNHNGISRNPFTELFIQLFGVFAGFSFCLIAASLLSPTLKVQYSFFVLFIGFFLIFSNLWTYILILLGKLREKYWPITSFKKKPLGLIGQIVLSLIVTSLLTGLVSAGWKILVKLSSLALQ